MLAHNFSKKYEIIDTDIFLNILSFEKENDIEKLKKMKQSSISKFIYEQYEIPDFLYENKKPIFLRENENFIFKKILKILLPSYRSGFSSKLFTLNLLIKAKMY